MRRIGLALLVLLSLVLPVATWVQGAEPAMSHNVILVGWDGAHRDHVKKLLSQGKLPNLQKLINEGTLVDIDITSGATDTKAGWTQILTGYRPEVTGVYNNGRYRDVPAGYSIFERLKARFKAEAIALVAVIGKSAHCGEINPPFKKPLDQTAPGESPDAPKPKRKRLAAAGKPDEKPKRAKAKPAGRVVEEGGVKYLVFDGSPYYTMHKSCDEWHFGLREDQKVGDTTLKMLDKYGKRPFFFFVHFAEVDHSGHKHGESSPEYDNAIISNDQQLGRIVEKLKQLGVYERTLIYVTADHGFDVGGFGHRDAPYVFLGTNDKQVKRNGTRACLLYTSPSPRDS